MPNMFQYLGGLGRGQLEVRSVIKKFSFPSKLVLSGVEVKEGLREV